MFAAPSLELPQSLLNLPFRGGPMKHVLMSLAFASALATEAHAQVASSDWAICQAAEVSPEQLEASCTNVIASPGKDVDLALAFVQRGEAKADSGNLSGAIVDFNEASRLKPDWHVPFFNRAVAFNHQGQFDKAISDLKVAVRLAPLDALAQNELCWAYAMSGAGLSAGVGHCNMAVMLHPEHPSFRDSRALAYLKLGMLDLALADYDEAIRLRPDWSHYLYGRGIVLLRLGRKAEAEASLARSLALNADMGKTYEGYGIRP